MSNETQTSTLPLQPMHLPDAPSWFPFAWGWWALIAGAFLLVLIVILTWRWNKKRLAPKKTALRLLERTLKPSEAMELLRQAALCYYPRTDIAQLTGDKWYEFLDAQVDSSRFVPNQSAWQQVLYSKQTSENDKELIQHCIEWVEHALPAKKRRN